MKNGVENISDKEILKMMEMQQVKTIDVLGVPYAVINGDRSKDSCLDKADGYCDHTIKTCVIDTLLKTSDSLGDLDAYRKQVIRHELVHAFLFESGLGAESWGCNEEIVDWIAFQFPKMLRAFEEADAL